jgi:hypothetical protein
MACFLQIAFLMLLLSGDQAKTDVLRLISKDIDLSARLNPASIAGMMYVFDLIVNRHEARFAFTTVISQVKDEDEAIKVLENGFGWKDGYFFLRLECGGGNAWRCDREQVFAKMDDNLVHIDWRNRRWPKRCKTGRVLPRRILR